MTPASLAYLDTSAYAKLALREPEAQALRARLEGLSRMSSALLVVEAIRACARYGPVYEARAEEGLADVVLVPIDDAVLRAAARLRPPALRSLDAIHLATALIVADRLDAFVSYDERLCEAALAEGLPVSTPR